MADIVDCISVLSQLTSLEIKDVWSHKNFPFCLQQLTGLKNLKRFDGSFDIPFEYYNMWPNIEDITFNDTKVHRPAFDLTAKTKIRSLDCQVQFFSSIAINPTQLTSLRVTQTSVSPDINFNKYSCLKSLDINTTPDQIIQLNDLASLTYLKFNAINRQYSLISNLTNLKVLDLTHVPVSNQIKCTNGTFSDQNAYLPFQRLEELRIDITSQQNKVIFDTGSIKADTLTKLEVKLMEAIEINVSRLTALRELKIRSMKISTYPIKALNSLSSLQYLTKLVVDRLEIDASMISTCYQLKHLELPLASISSDFKLTNLEYLNVKKLPLKGISDISNLTSLTVQVYVQTLFRLTSLSLLQFSNDHPNPTDEYWRTLGTMTTLTDLTLKQPEKDDQWLNLSTLTNLKRMTVIHTVRKDFSTSLVPSTLTKLRMVVFKGVDRTSFRKMGKIIYL